MSSAAVPSPVSPHHRNGVGVRLKRHPKQVPGQSHGGHQRSGPKCTRDWTTRLRRRNPAAYQPDYLRVIHAHRIVRGWGKPLFIASLRWNWP